MSKSEEIGWEEAGAEEGPVGVKKWVGGDVPGRGWKRGEMRRPQGLGTVKWRGYARGRVGEGRGEVREQTGTGSRTKGEYAGRRPGTPEKGRTRLGGE